MLTNYNHTSHVTGRMIKKNLLFHFLIILFLAFSNKYITTQNMVFMNFGALNFNS